LLVRTDQPSAAVKAIAEQLDMAQNHTTGGLMKKRSPHPEQPGDIYLVLSAEEAELMVEALVSNLRSASWKEEPRAKMTALALFLRDYLGYQVHVPAMAAGPVAKSRSAA
jgi:hypothetical protein